MAHKRKSRKSSSRRKAPRRIATSRRRAPLKRATRRKSNMAKKRSSRRRSSFTSRFGAQNALIGGAAVVVIEPLVENLVNNFAPQQDVLADAAKLGLGIWATKARMPAVKEGGKALAYIASRDLMKRFIGGTLGNLFSGLSSNGAASDTSTPTNGNGGSSF